MKTLIRILLGAVFIVSGVAKAIDTQTFIGLIQGYDIGPLAYAAIIVPPVEILLGLFFWLNFKVKISSLLMMVCTIFFTLVFAEVLLTKGIRDCGCFGSIKFLKLPPWGTFLRNALIIAGSYFLYKNPPAESPKYGMYKLVAIWIIGVAGFTVSAISFTKPMVGVATAVNHEDLTGKDVNMTPLKEYYKFDPKKRYAIYVFSPECYHCWDNTANIKSLVEAGSVDEVIGIAPFELMKSEKDYEEKLKPNFKVLMTPYSKFDKITSVTPVLIMIQNNKIVEYNNTGIIHSGFTVNKFFISHPDTAAKTAAK